ncbi:MAG: YihY/virulence factor BrkB family protein, partial [Eudoraea sp.]|nr:YihY/virulence factor BrkB family protein [Eudoraea sp.]
YVYVDLYILEYLSVWAAKTRGYDLTQNHILGAKVGKFVFFTVLSYFTTATLYYFGTAEGKKAKFFSYGALMTTLLFLLTSYLFGVYIEKIARYNELYGALGGLLILMIYIWINSIILLLGFELNATLNYLHKSLGRK